MSYICPLLRRRHYDNQAIFSGYPDSIWPDSACCDGESPVYGARAANISWDHARVARNYPQTGEANSFGLLVYYNDTLLIKDTDYIVASDGPRITLTFDPTIGDTIIIREYNSTYGSYVPETPTKLGLYPRKDPIIFTDDSYATPRTIIQGHDGSMTIGFDDVRDEVLLEFERRIYNNLKSLESAPPPIVESRLPENTSATIIKNQQYEERPTL